MVPKHLVLCISPAVGCSGSHPDQTAVPHAGSGAAGSSALDAGRAQAVAGSHAPSAVPFDSYAERARCLARSIEECERVPTCGVAYGSAAARGCRPRLAAAFCGLRESLCGLAVFCAFDTHGVHWSFPTYCGRTEVQLLGWRFDDYCDAKRDRDDDAGAESEDGGADDSPPAVCEAR